MRSPGSVYRKLREVKHVHLVELYKEYLSRRPENCRYNYLYKFESGKTVKELRLCLCHQDNPDNLDEGIYTHLLDVCEQIGDCSRCNAFTPRYSKEDVKKILEDELNDKKLKARKYPDICALEWVLERSVVGIPPLTWLQSWYFSIKRALAKNIL